MAPPLPALADVARVSSRRLPVQPPPPELPPGRAIVFLLDAATGLEDRLLRAWIERLELAPGPDIVGLAPSRIRRPTKRTNRRLGELLRAPSDPWLVPLRVVWLPTERQGRRTVSWLDVIKLGDPRDPRWWRDYAILARHPDRVQIVVGRGAGAAELAADHAASVEHGETVEFVKRRAWRALDRAERAVRGDRYKISRFVAEDIAGRPRFRDEVVDLGRAKGLPEAMAMARARYYLAEIAASHSPFVIDLIANLIHWVYSGAYGAIRYDPATVARVAQLGRDHPVAFLPSHRSNMDRLALQFMLWENDMPPNHTAGGINMNFFPVGPLLRRTGVFFIRRTFKDNPLYKFVLKTYLDYLIEKRFPLEWYMEGGRSRSGKLLPPQFGMLSWVVDSLVDGKADDLYLLPISIAYDQIQDVDSYAGEAGGGSKEKESLSWALRLIGNLRRRHGDIHVSFAEPISVGEELRGRRLSGDDPGEVRKLAFEVMYRIGSVTPVTPTAVVSIVLLATRHQALDTEAIAARCTALTTYIGRRGLPTTVDLKLSTDADVERVMAEMIENKLISSHTAGERTVYWMEPGQMLRASYYRNMVVHFFVPRALAEVALAAPGIVQFWDDVFALRDLLKFEFFFADKDEFRHLVAADLDADLPGWDERVAHGQGSELRLDPPTAPWAVAPLLEAYMIVADELARRTEPIDEKPFLKACLERGRLYRLEGRIASEESVSQVLFRGALLLAHNRELIEDGPELARRRRHLADEVSSYVARSAR